MELQIFDYEQGSADWYQVRLGLATASEFATVMASGKGGGESKTRRTYMLKLLGERLTGQPAENYSNQYMERGKVMEAEARELYALVTGNECRQVGFIRRGDTGCSPDSLIGDDGVLEVKTRTPHLQLDTLLRDEIPPEYLPQLNGQLWVSGRAWVDVLCYWPGLPPLIKRVTRKESELNAIAVAVGQFNQELAALEARFAPKRKAA